MKIDIEVLVLLLIGLLVLLWFIWLKLSKLFHNWRYKEKNDKAKIGEEHRQELLRQGRPDPVKSITTTINDSGGQGGTKERSSIPATDANTSGKDSAGVRKSSRRRKLFRRRR